MSAKHCAWCAEPPHIRQGNTLLCQMHYRISSMRSRAKRDNKVAPTRAEIEALVPSPFVCAPCGREMTWLRTGGASAQATLQHDRSGSLRILCLGCNTRHAAHAGDSFYDIPADMKFCADCSQTKPRAEFCADRSRPIGLKAYCRPCSSSRNKKWRMRHCGGAQHPHHIERHAMLAARAKEPGA